MRKMDQHCSHRNQPAYMTLVIAQEFSMKDPRSQDYRPKSSGQGVALGSGLGLGSQRTDSKFINTFKKQKGAQIKKKPILLLFASIWQRLEIGKSWKNRENRSKTRGTSKISLVTTVTRKATMQLLILDLKRQKTSLGLGNLLVNKCGQYRGPNAIQTCPLLSLPSFVLERLCRLHVSLD